MQSITTQCHKVIKLIHLKKIIRFQEGLEVAKVNSLKDGHRGQETVRKDH